MKRTLTIGLAALGLLTATAACARSLPAPVAASAQGGWHHAQHHHADRLAQLKAQLKITPAQEPAWNAFVAAMQAMRPQASRGMAGMHEKAGQLTPAPRVFDKMAERATRRADKAHELAKAVRALYDELTPVQRAIVDTHLADMRHRMERHHEKGSWGHHARPMPPDARGGIG